jgi:putative PIN family toxin of toxin-antitoxin system
VIRVVVDTNVLISALLTAGGSPDQVLVAIRNRRLVPYVSPDLLAEYGEVVRRPKFLFEHRQISGVERLIAEFGVLVSVEQVPGGYLARLPDAKDEKVLLCALAADAEYIVTGNLRHFPQELCNPVKVINPHGLIEVLRTPNSP